MNKKKRNKLSTSKEVRVVLVERAWEIDWIPSSLIGFPSRLISARVSFLLKQTPSNFAPTEVILFSVYF